MNSKLVTILDSIFNLGVILLVFLTPLFFWDKTTEFYETPKFLLLLASIGVFIVLWTIRYILLGKTSFNRTSLDLPLILLLTVLVISTIFAASRTTAIIGNIPRVHGSLASFVLYIMLYFILVSNIKSIKFVERVIHTLIFSGVILSILTLLSYFGKNFLPFPWASSLSFTPTGSSFSTTAIIALLLPFPLVAILRDTEPQTIGSIIIRLKNLLRGVGIRQVSNKIVLSVILLLFLATIILTGSVATYTAMVVAFVLILVAISPASFKKNLLYIAVPLIIAVLLLVFSNLSFGGSRNFLHNQAKFFPQELQLPLSISWKISISTFRDFPLWGSGPASYLADFTAYKGAEFNNLKFWTVKFDQAFNEYLQVLATLGALGLIALLSLTIIFISTAIKTLTRPMGSLDISLAISGILFFVTLTLHTSTLPVWVIGIIILSAFMIVMRRSKAASQIDISTPQSGNSNLNPHFDILPLSVCIIILILIVGMFYFTARFTLADYNHRLALNSVDQGKAVDSYNFLQKTEKLNPYTDLYRVDLAQTNFALANALATAKGPSEASPSGSLTEKDKQDIQKLLSQAIDEGRAATILNPTNSGNWEILGSVYRQISGVAQNALAFALDSYGQAIKLDPVNPQLRLTVGGIYYSVKNYDLAIRFFTDAVNLKPDWANAYYNLSLATKEKGDLVSAISFAQKTISLLEPSSPDYQKATELLSNLQSQQASSSASLESATPQSALQNKNLPKVLTLPKTTKTSTPSAVKK